MKIIRNLAVILAMMFPLAGQAQDWAKFSRFEQKNKEVSIKPRAVFMGDSITEGWDNQDPDFFTSNNFLGRGISGQTTSHMLVRFRNDVIKLDPKYVVILAGTNDIAKNNGDITLDNVMGNIISMCELAKANRIRPILCAVLPATGFHWRPRVMPAEDIMKLNEMIKAYAESWKIPFVDYHTALKDSSNGLPKEYAEDGVHPNLQCYRIMEEMILKHIR
jgi:lysophospholipase L1-like esterase